MLHPHQTYSTDAGLPIKGAVSVVKFSGSCYHPHLRFARAHMRTGCFIDLYTRIMILCFSAYIAYDVVTLKRCVFYSSFVSLHGGVQPLLMMLLLVVSEVSGIRHG